MAEGSSWKHKADWYEKQYNKLARVVLSMDASLRDGCTSCVYPKQGKECSPTCRTLRILRWIGRLNLKSGWKPEEHTQPTSPPTPHPHAPTTGKE